MHDPHPEPNPEPNPARPTHHPNPTPYSATGAMDSKTLGERAGPDGFAAVNGNTTTTLTPPVTLTLALTLTPPRVSRSIT